MDEEKVKIFSLLGVLELSEMEKLEKEINQWLKEGAKRRTSDGFFPIEIIDRKTNVAVATNSDGHYMLNIAVMIFYK